MFRSLILDVAFLVAVFVETFAGLSLIYQLVDVPMRHEIESLLAFYHTTISPLASFPLQFIFAPGAIWYADAFIISFILGFLFLFKQVVQATAPHSSNDHDAGYDGFSLSERVADRLFAVIVAGLASLVASFALLPMLTPFGAGWLLWRRKKGKPHWFELSNTYFSNLVLVLLIIGTVLILSR